MSSSARTCGECRLCCKAMGIPELRKPPDVWCPHAGDHPGGGCGIYETRPDSCRVFNCSWLQDDMGFFRDTDRPDRIGVVFWMQAGGGRDIAGQPVNVIVASERHAGAALQHARSREIIQKIRSRGVAVSIACGGAFRPVQITREGRFLLGDPPPIPSPDPHSSGTA